MQVVSDHNTNMIKKVLHIILCAVLVSATIPWMQACAMQEEMGESPSCQHTPVKDVSFVAVPCCDCALSTTQTSDSGVTVEQKANLLLPVHLLAALHAQAAPVVRPSISHFIFYRLPHSSSPPIFILNAALLI